MECPFNYQWNYSNITHRLSYDLCPLFLHHRFLKHEIIEDTPPTQTKHIYDIALGVGLKKDGTLPADMQCPPDSFICLTVINTRPSHPSEPPRILQVVPVASGDMRPQFCATNTTTGVDYTETHLQLTMDGLLYMKQKQKAVFHMQCVKSEDVSKPQLEFLYTWKGAHVFNWKTIYGCPKVTELPDESKHGGSDSGDGPETSWPPPDPGTDEGIPIPTPPGSPLSPLSLGTVIVIILVILRVIIPRKYEHRLQHLARYASFYKLLHQENESPLGETTTGSEMQPLRSRTTNLTHY